MSELNRREFVIAAACAAGACLLCGGASLEAAGAAGGVNQIDIGTPADYPKDGIVDKLADTRHILVARDNSKIYAMTSRCSHRGSTVKLDEGELICPKHHSHFANDGHPTSGPAKAALFRHAISLNADGHIIVDTSKQFGQNEWTDPAASISVK